MKKIFYIFVCFMFFYFIVYPSKAFYASQNGILLWFNQILPTLLPLSILSNVMLAVGNGSGSSRTKNFGHITGFEWFVIICGMCFGFPIGSKLTADIYKNGQTSAERARILCAFTNNMSPAFVSSFVCCNTLKDSSLILPVFLALYLPPLIIGCFLLSKQPLETYAHKKTASRFQIDMQIVDAGIVSSFVTLIKLCGYIVMFSITADLFVHMGFLPKPLRYLLVGLTEVTNGTAQLAHIAYPAKVKILLAVFFLAFGGISGLAQTNSMLSQTGLSIRSYIRFKLLYTVCSVLLCLCMLLFGSFFR